MCSPYCYIDETLVSLHRRIVSSFIDEHGWIDASPTIEQSQGHQKQNCTDYRKEAVTVTGKVRNEKYLSWHKCRHTKTEYKEAAISCHLNTTSFESWLQTSAAVHHRHWIPLGTMHKEMLHLPGGTWLVAIPSSAALLSKLEISLSSSSHSGFHVKLLRGYHLSSPKVLWSNGLLCCGRRWHTASGRQSWRGHHWKFVCFIHLFSRGTFDLVEGTQVAASPKKLP